MALQPEAEQSLAPEQWEPPSPLWDPPRKGKLPCNRLACLAVTWCHQWPWGEARAAQLCVTGFLHPAGNGISPLPPGLGACGRRRMFHIPADWDMRGCQEWTQITGAHYLHYSGNASSWLQQGKFSQCPMCSLQMSAERYLMSPY